MSNDPSLSAVTPDHATQFGFIINIFAKLEIHMQTAAAGILNTDLATAIILMGGTPYRQKQQTLRHLNQTIGVNGHIDQDLIAILDDLKKFSILRNQIAHCLWVSGRRPGMIKPMQLILRTNAPEPLGHYHNEKNRSVADLHDAAGELEAISRRFVAFLSRSGLSARVAANIEKIASLSTSSPGKPCSE